jgi:copper(I)-binding protein
MVKLEPGGLHVMLINLQKKLVPGEEASITLVFEDGSKQEITVPIKKMQMTMMKHDMKNMKH